VPQRHYLKDRVKDVQEPPSLAHSKWRAKRRRGVASIPLESRSEPPHTANFLRINEAGNTGFSLLLGMVAILRLRRNGRFGSRFASARHTRTLPGEKLRERTAFSLQPLRLQAQPEEH
jgi:hypothetical protein